MGERKAFDPTDPFDTCCEAIRLAMGDAALQAVQSALYRELSPSDQVECLVRGMLVATIGVAFSIIKPEGRDELLKIMAGMLPEMAEHAEAIIRNGARAEGGR